MIAPPKSIGELIDEVERVREDLFRLQKIEVVETVLSGQSAKRGNVKNELKEPGEAKDKSVQL